MNLALISITCAGFDSRENWSWWFERWFHDHPRIAVCEGGWYMWVFLKTIRVPLLAALNPFVHHHFPYSDCHLGLSSIFIYTKHWSFAQRKSQENDERKRIAKLEMMQRRQFLEKAVPFQADGLKFSQWASDASGYPVRHPRPVDTPVRTIV